MFDQFAICVGGPTKFLQCITSPALKLAFGISLTTATSMSRMAHLFKAMCTPPIKQVFKANSRCILKTISLYGRHLDYCTYKYKQQSKKDPPNACKYAKEEIACRNLAYAKCCPDTLVKSMCAMSAAALLAVPPTTPPVPCVVPCV